MVLAVPAPDVPFSALAEPGCVLSVVLAAGLLAVFAAFDPVLLPLQAASESANSAAPPSGSHLLATGLVVIGLVMLI